MGRTHPPDVFEVNIKQVLQSGALDLDNNPLTTLQRGQVDLQQAGHQPAKQPSSTAATTDSAGNNNSNKGANWVSLQLDTDQSLTAHETDCSGTCEHRAQAVSTANTELHAPC